jgi:ATP-binding cassette subfamily B protein
MIFLVRFLFRNLKGYRFLTVIIIAATILAVLISLQLPLLIKYTIDRIISPMKDPGPPWINILNLFNPTSPGQQHNALAVVLFFAIMYVILAVFGGALAYVQQFLAAFIAQNLSAHLRKTLFDQLQRLSLDWHGRQKKGDLVQRITGDITNIEKLVIDGLVDVFAGALTLLLSTWILWNTQWQLTLISIVVVPALFIIILAYTRYIGVASRRAAKAVGEVADVASEDVGAITLLKAFSLEDQEAIRFNRYVGKSQQAGMEAGALQAQFTPVVDVLVSIGTAVILLMGGIAVATGTFPLLNIKPAPAVTVGTLTLFISYLKELYRPMRELSKLTNAATNAVAGAERIQEVLDQAPEITENAIPYTGPQRLKGDIMFENVVFGYMPQRPILKGINLHIAAGKKVALVGLSGGGKTTLIKLIPRFYEVQQGAVKIDRVDNRFYPLSILRRNVSQVLQESVLFEGTILDNLIIGRPEASRDEIVAAAKQAHVHDTILSWPDGYDTKVRERGKNLSGGQRQRLAIARAILTNSPILILDEPTASLDVEAEAEVLRAIDALVVGRTVLMISHRLSTLGNVDEIIVLKDGHIVEQGTYQELKRRDGVFAGLLKEQNRYNMDYVGKSMIVPKAELIQQGLNPHISSPELAHIGDGAGVRRQWQAEGRSPRGFAHNARLVIVMDEKIIKEHQLVPTKPLLTVGRLSGNDVQIPNQRVSRLHARIRWVNGAWMIEDADSVNGLIYEGNRVERHILTNGDCIYIAPKVAILYETKS